MTERRGPAFEDETATLVHPPGPKLLGAVIRPQGCKASPEQLRVTRGSCILGSAPQADLTIEEPTVSRRHARLTLVPEGVLVEDLQSHNGVHYLGHRVERMVLAFGARIELGTASVAIDVDAQALGDEVPPFPASSYRGMVGPSLPMRRLFAVLERLEGSLVTVLVGGESGVGKELVATALHEGSAAASGPLVTLNCGAIAPDLVASELFGHRRGAFSGAVEARPGALVSAHEGTLFLDEVGELPLPVQPMLLRTLESGEVRPVGGDTTGHVKVRVVAATNRDLDQEVAAGRFRKDLYYRLAVVRLTVPPLRDRPDDIETLAQHFAHQFDLQALPRDVLDNLRGRTWTGNVRELRNVIEAYGAIGTLSAAGPVADGGLDAALSQRIDLDRPYAELKDALIERFTHLYLEQLLERTDGNQTRAAAIAGLGRAYLGRLVAKHGILRK